MVVLPDSASMDGRFLNSGWIPRKTDIQAAAMLEERLGLGSLAAATLAARGFTSYEDAQAFLSCTLEKTWGNALELPGLREVADHVEAAVRASKRILIYGDYDVDGLTASALLYKALQQFGTEAKIHIPHRAEDGYGFTETSVERILSYAPDTVITVDCGIAARNEIAELTQRGIEVIVTDHHEPAFLIPKDVPVADPKLDPESPDTILAGVGVVLKLVELLSERFGCPELWRSYIDLATLGTIADLMPLMDKNRALVREGLTFLNTSLRPGIAALYANSRLAGKKISATDLSYSILPQLNAAGRMGDAYLSLELLLCDDVNKAFDLAKQLEHINFERRRIEREMTKEAEQQAAHCPTGVKVLVLGDEGWHDGVKGIVASRIARAFGVPAIVFSIDGETARGSGRSVGSINLFEAIEQCVDLLDRFGGHSSAVGITLHRSKLSEFRARLGAILAEESEELFHPPLLVDARVKLAALKPKTVSELSILEPYGQDNPEPIYLAENVFIQQVKTVGAERNHLSFMLSDGASSLGAIWFNCPDIEHWQHTDAIVDAAFAVKVETWNGKISVKLHIKELFEKRVLRIEEGLDSDPDSHFGTNAIAKSKNDTAQHIESLSTCSDTHSAGTAPYNEMSTVKMSAPERLCTPEEWRLLAHGTAVQFASAFVAEHLGRHIQLHEAQKEALCALERKENTLAIMATGRGKSLIFQIHATQIALREKSASIFIYPLRALINDQAFHLERQLAEMGLRAVRLTGEVRSYQRTAALHAFDVGEADIILTTPEFFELHGKRFAEMRTIGFIVVDEAHHIATASAQHRSAYLRLEALSEQFPHATVLGITATADTKAAEAIQAALEIDTVIVDVAERGNLALVDHRGIRARDHYIASTISSGNKCLVYVTTRDHTMELTRTLRKLTPTIAERIVFYHAGLTDEDRKSIENSLRTDTVCCVVCTSAFGEGINIPDIRHVILYNLPFSSIEFNQLAGRAGRDGALSEVHLVFNRDDGSLNDRILTRRTPTRDELAVVWHALQEIGYDSFEMPTDAFFAKDEVDGQLLGYLLERSRSLKRSFALDERGMIAALDIFEDLGLIALKQQEKMQRVTIVRPVTKVDLHMSLLYTEGTRELQEFETFKRWIIQAKPEDITRQLNRPLVPDSNELLRRRDS